MSPVSPQCRTWPARSSSGTMPARRTTSPSPCRIRTELISRRRGKSRTTLEGAVAKFLAFRLVEHVGRIGASEPEVADDPERPCREAEAPVEGRFQGPPLRGNADPASRLLVSALPTQLPR